MPCRGAVWVAVLAEMGVALRVGVVERGRTVRVRREIGGERRRRQRRQIMVGVSVFNGDGGTAVLQLLPKVGMDR